MIKPLVKNTNGSYRMLLTKPDGSGHEVKRTAGRYLL